MDSLKKTNREIRFKIWDKASMSWVKVKSKLPDLTGYFETEELKYNYRTELIPHHDWEVFKMIKTSPNRYEYFQVTDILDKNKVRISEGDFLWSDTWLNGYVVFGTQRVDEDNYFSDCNGFFIYSPQFKSFKTLSQYKAGNTYLINGNVKDNPEFLRYLN